MKIQEPNKGGPSRGSELFLPRLLVSLSDTVLILGVIFGVQWFWPLGGSTLLNGLSLEGELVPTQTALSLGIVALWLVALWQIGAWNAAIFGTGATEYLRVVRASVLTFVATVLCAFIAKVEIARGYVLLALPLGLILLLITRWLWRRYLVRQRKAGKYLGEAVVIGSLKVADDLCKRLSESPETGIQVVGAFLSQRNIPLTESKQLSLAKSGVPVLGGVDDMLPVIRSQNVQIVIIGSTDDLGPAEVRNIGWELLPTREKLYLAANIADIAGPRLSIKPVSGLPLIEVDQPQIQGVNRALKRWVDILLSITLLVLSSPVIFWASVAIKQHDRGPIFFTQTRVGRAGTPFKMFKLRTMRINAEIELAKLHEIEHDAAGNTILFKLKDDPRITQPGRWIRRFSIDELPQLVNVLLGQMSIVGPRPPLRSEVDQYESYVFSRLLVKPGITGLWQVSGRSDLSWEESVRADLSYVQNWSIMLDTIILWRTFKAVFSGRGAY